MSRLTIYIIIFGVLSSLIIGDDPCRFEDSSKGVIDLTSMGRTDGTPAFPNNTGSETSFFAYSYNPCIPFSEGTECSNVAVCQRSKDGNLRFALGTQDSAKWNSGAGSEDGPFIIYTSGPRQSKIILECSDSIIGEFDAIEEEPENFHLFVLAHKCACWSGSNSTTPEPESTTSSSEPTTPKSRADGTGGGIKYDILFLALTAIIIIL